MKTLTGLSVTALWMVLFTLASPCTVTAQSDDTLVSPAYRFGIGLGYLSTSGDITSIWGNGFALNLTLGYRPWTSVGIDLTGIYASTSISGWMKNKVYVEYPSSGEREHRETTGGNHYELLVGPTWYVQIPGTQLAVSAGAGGRYSACQEAGLSNIEGYLTRWTYGWGGYARLGIELFTETGLGIIVYGVRGHYMIGHIKVNDFYYDRVYGKSSYDEIDPTYLSDRRLHVSLDVILEFR